MIHAGALAVQQVHNSTSTSPVVLALAGFVGGFAVGLTGMGGGALMTPALVLLFKVDPKVAVASDLVNSLVMKPIGGTVHVRRGTIHWRLVALMGPLVLAGTALRLLTIDAVLARLSRKLGLRVAAVRLSNPLVGVDVDKPEDHALADSIIAGRA